MDTTHAGPIATGRRLAWAVAVAAAAALAGCEEPTTIAEPVRVVDPFISINDLPMPGQATIVRTVTVPPEAVHPHFAGTWTVLDVERPVDLYVFKAGEYDDRPTAPPPDQQAYRWPEEPYPPGAIGRGRTGTIAMHPTSGDWVFVFHNPLSGVPAASRAELSATIELNYLVR